MQNRFRKRIRVLVFLPTIIILFIFLYFWWYFIIDCIPRDMVDFKKSKISNGVVSKVFFNKSDHGHFYIYIKQGEEKILLKPYYNYYGSDLSKIVNVGDTIYKERDSMSFILKNNTKSKLVKFNCDIGAVLDR